MLSNIKQNSVSDRRGQSQELGQEGWVYQQTKIIWQQSRQEKNFVSVLGTQKQKLIFLMTEADEPQNDEL
jgi:hypothetical protein